MTRLWFNDSCLPTFQFTKTILLLLLSLVECWIWLNLYVLHYWGLLLEIITRIKVSYWLNLTREVAEFQFLISCRMCGQLWQCQCTFKKYFFLPLIECSCTSGDWQIIALTPTSLVFIQDELLKSLLGVSSMEMGLDSHLDPFLLHFCCSAGYRTVHVPANSYETTKHKLQKNSRTAGRVLKISISDIFRLLVLPQNRKLFPHLCPI